MARRSRRSNTSGLPYLAVGLALGLAVAAGVYFSDLRSGAGLPESAQRARPETADRAARGGAAADAASSAAAAAVARPQEASGAAAAQSTASPRPADAAERSSPAPASDEPRFDFYEILPQYEVLVPEEVETVARPTAPAAPVAAPGSYVLQTGSFRSHADADRMQASLALLGVESRIQKVAIDAGEFHRVRIGPISNLDELNRIRTVLRQAGIESLMMKVD